MHRFRGALVALLVVCAPFTADAKWIRIQSANFLFIGDASEAQMRRQAENLERFREVLGRVLPAASRPNPLPTIVFVFANQKSLQPYKPQFQGKPVAVAGYFLKGDDVNYLAVAPDGNAAFHTIFHEYTHFVTSNAAGLVPVWVSEGLAEAYSTFESKSDGRSASIGLATAEHVLLLRNSRLMPLSELMAVTHASPVYNEGDRRSVLYAESWALVHYLMFGSPARAGQIERYLTLLRADTPQDAAFASAFGDSTALERELAAYMRNDKFPGIRFTFDERTTAVVDARASVVEDADVAGYLGELLDRLDREDDARTALERAWKQYPESARVALSLGTLHVRRNRVPEGLPLLEKAAAAARDNATAQTAYGRALVMDLQEHLADDAVMQAQAGIARGVLNRAVELDPNNAMPVSLLGYVELIAGADAQRAGTLLDKAVQLAPGREQFRVLAAQAWLRQGDTMRATNYLGPLLAGGSTPEIRAAAREALGTVAAIRQARDAATRAPSATTGAATGATAAAASPSTLTTATGVPDRAAARRLMSLIEPDGTRRPMSVDAGSGMMLALRPLKAGETRVVGMFRAVDCQSDGLVLRIDAEGRTLSLAARRFEDIEFITYVENAPGTVPCGVFGTASRVLATYRPRTPAATNESDGDAVAIELVSPTFVPRD